LSIIYVKELDTLTKRHHMANKYKFRIETKDLRIIPCDGCVDINFNTDNNDQLLSDVVNIITDLTLDDLKYDESINLLMALQNVINKENGE